MNNNRLLVLFLLIGFMVTYVPSAEADGHYVEQSDLQFQITNGWQWQNSNCYYYQNGSKKAGWLN